MLVKKLMKNYTQNILKKKEIDKYTDFYMLFGEQDPDGFDEQERSIKSIISTENPDRVNDIIRADGMGMKDFRNNPVVFQDHDRAQPIGKNLYIKTTKRDDGVKALVAKTVFAKTRAGLERLWLHKEGFLNAWSVGIMVQEWKELPNQGMDIEASMLLEYSSVGIPMNAEALDIEKVQKLMDNENVSQKMKLNILEQKGTLQFMNLVYNNSKNYEKDLSDIKSLLIEIKERKAAATGGADFLSQDDIRKLFKNLN